MLTRLLIAYASDHGTTRQVAAEVAAGASQVQGCLAEARDVEMLTTDDLRERDALVLGSPVHMGGCHWAMKQFIDRTLGPLWMTDALEGKVGAVFATGSGGSGGGGAELNLLSMLSALTELGLIVVPLPRSIPGNSRAGLHWGPVFPTENVSGRPQLVDPELVTARLHGMHVARAARCLHSETVFAAESADGMR